MSTLDDASSKTVHRDVVLLADASPEGQAIAVALRAQGFAVATSTIERLDTSVLVETPRVLIVDIDQPGARVAIERIRDLEEGARAELVCLGSPSRAAEVGATTASGRAFTRPVEIHALVAQISALADPAPLDEDMISGNIHETGPRHSGESVPPFVEDGSGAFSAVFQSVFPGGPDAAEVGGSIFPPDDTEGPLPTALLAAHPMQLSPELTDLLAAAEQKVMLADALMSLPPAPQTDDDADVVLGDDYLSLLDDPVDLDEEEEPGTGPEMAQTGALELSTGPIAIPGLSTPLASRSVVVAAPDSSPPTNVILSTVGGSPPVDSTLSLPRAFLGHVREPINVREFVAEKLPISFADEASANVRFPHPSQIVMDQRPTSASSAITVVESLRPSKTDESQLPTRRLGTPGMMASVPRPAGPILIDASSDTQPPTVFPGRTHSPGPKLDGVPHSSLSSPTTQPSAESTVAPNTAYPSTVDPPMTVPPSSRPPASPPPMGPPMPSAAMPKPAALSPPTAKPQSPPPRDVLMTIKSVSPPVAPPSPPAPLEPGASSSTPASPRATKPTDPTIPPPNVVRRAASDPPPSVRLAPPVPPPPAPLITGAPSEPFAEPSLQVDKPTVLGPGDAPRALARAIASRVTGSLALHSQGSVRRVVLHEGDVVTAGSGAPEETLLSFLAARGDIEREVAMRLAGKLPPGGRHAGAALIAHGYLGQDALWSVLRAHAEWIIGRFLLADTGTLELEPEPPGRLRTEPSVFGGSMGAEVFVEAMRRIVPPEVALGRLGGPAARMDNGLRISLLAECALRPDERTLATNATGATIGELVEKSGGDTPTLLYALICLEVLSVLVPSKHVEKSRPSQHDPLDQEAIRMRVRARMALVEEGDYFAVLGVPRGATSYEIRRAFIDLRRSFEPSRLLTAETADLSADVRTVLEVLDEAYEILKDTHRRERYRRAIEAGPS